MALSAPFPNPSEFAYNGYPQFGGASTATVPYHWSVHFPSLPNASDHSNSAFSSSPPDLKHKLYRSASMDEELIKEENPKPRKGGVRRYKTPSPQLLRSRREAANARERKRMNSLNSAFDKLRTVLPTMDHGRRLSKYETLQLAQYYISGLSKMLGENNR